MSQIESARNVLKQHLDGIRPSIAIILGSGCSIEPDQVFWELTASNIPGFITPKVEGHSGCVTAGVIGRQQVLLIQGRVHTYEGHTWDRVTFQVRLMHALGIPNIIFFSAAGGIQSSLNPGDIMLVKDHICTQPLGATRRSGPVYDPFWIERVISVCDDVPVSSGVFVWTLGPSYETPTEILSFERRGGDAVGMSLVPEALEAAALDMNVLAAAVITNSAAGLGEEQLAHEDVLRAAGQARTNLANLLSVAVDQAPEAG